MGGAPKAGRGSLGVSVPAWGVPEVAPPVGRGNEKGVMLGPADAAEEGSEGPASSS